MVGHVPLILAQVSDTVVEGMMPTVQIIAIVVSAVAFIFAMRHRDETQRSKSQLELAVQASRIAGVVDALSSQLAAYNEQLQGLKASVREDLKDLGSGRDETIRQVGRIEAEGCAMRTRLDRLHNDHTVLVARIDTVVDRVHELDVTVGALKTAAEAAQRTS